MENRYTREADALHALADEVKTSMEWFYTLDRQISNITSQTIDVSEDVSVIGEHVGNILFGMRNTADYLERHAESLMAAEKADFDWKDRKNER